MVTDIPEHVTGVRWNPAVPGEGLYTLKDGFFNERTSSQMSTLTIANRQIANLLEKSEKDTVTFTCEITVGKEKTSVTATQLLTLHESRGEIG